MHPYIEALNWRYATKKFSDKKVSKKDIEEIIEVFRLSASSFGLQPWKLFIVEDYEFKQELEGHAFNQPQVGGSSHILVFARKNDIDKDFVNDFLDSVVEIQEVEKALLSGYEQTLHNFVEKQPENAKDIWAREQVFLALGNVMSFLAHKKIDSCAIGGFNAAAYDEVLGLTERGYTATVVLPIGYRSEDDSAMDRKKVRYKREKIVEFITKK